MQLLSQITILGSQDNEVGGLLSREARLTNRLRVAESEVKRLRKNLGTKGGKGLNNINENQVCWYLLKFREHFIREIFLMRTR